MKATNNVITIRIRIRIIKQTTKIYYVNKNVSDYSANKLGVAIGVKSTVELFVSCSTSRSLSV